jgi:hypothetical protein
VSSMNHHCCVCTKLPFTMKPPSNYLAKWLSYFLPYNSHPDRASNNGSEDSTSNRRSNGSHTHIPLSSQLPHHLLQHSASSTTSIFSYTSQFHPRVWRYPGSIPHQFPTSRESPMGRQPNRHGNRNSSAEGMAGG